MNSFSWDLMNRCYTKSNQQKFVKYSYQKGTIMFILLQNRMVKIEFHQIKMFAETV